MEEVEPTAAVAIIPHAIAEYLFLCVNHTRRGWEWPGGKIDPGETPEEAVVREVMEEAGVKVRPVRRLFTKHVAGADGINYAVVGIECHTTQGLEPHETASEFEAQWMTWHELREAVKATDNMNSHPFVGEREAFYRACLTERLLLG